jgi:hypothetical protein
LLEVTEPGFIEKVIGYPDNHDNYQESPDSGADEEMKLGVIMKVG